jgi:membrane associated rhomboid family serine protease
MVDVNDQNPENVLSSFPLTIGLLGLLTVLYVLEASYGGFNFANIGNGASIDALVTYGGNAHILVVNQSEWWRLLTATLLHGSLAHIIMNSFSLWNLGRSLEKYFGRETLLTVFVITGIASSLSFALFGSKDTISIGASGAICGMLGFLISHGARNLEELTKQIQRNWINFALLFVIGFAIPNVDNWAHGGGVLAGIVLGLIYFRFSRAIRINLGRLSGVLLLSSAAWIFKLAILG